MSKRHQKAISAPKTYPIARKETTWTVTPNSGPHPKDECIPLGVIIRDVMGYADSISEVRTILEKQFCKVDGAVVKDYRYPVGIFDVVSLKDNHFRLVPSGSGFKIIEIDSDESNLKICRVDDKKKVKGGNIQVNLNDGKNVEVSEDSEVSTGSSVILSLPDNEIEEVLGLEEGSDVMITEGKNRGKVAEFKEEKVIKGSTSNRVIVEDEDREMNLPEDLVFPVNVDKVTVGGSEDE